MTSYNSTRTSASVHFTLFHSFTFWNAELVFHNYVL
jgi:hypothetical protein